MVTALEGMKFVEIHECVCLCLSKTPCGEEENRRTGEPLKETPYLLKHLRGIRPGFIGATSQNGSGLEPEEMSLEETPEASSQARHPDSVSGLSPPPAQGQVGCLTSACQTSFLWLETVSWLGPRAVELLGRLSGARTRPSPPPTRVPTRQVAPTTSLRGVTSHSLVPPDLRRTQR